MIKNYDGMHKRELPSLALDDANPAPIPPEHKAQAKLGYDKVGTKRQEILAGINRHQG